MVQCQLPYKKMFKYDFYWFKRKIRGIRRQKLDRRTTYLFVNLPSMHIKNNLSVNSWKRIRNNSFEDMIREEF